MHCGARLNAMCADCGVALPRAARFWPESGQPVAAAPAPASYTPRHISEQILAVRSAIEGERKQVSVHVWEAASPLKRENCSGAQCAQRATLGTYEGTSHCVHQQRFSVLRGQTATADGQPHLAGGSRRWRLT